MNRKDKEELFRLLEEKQRRISICPVANIEWNKEGQKRAADAVNIYNILLFSAGNRAGKTFWLVAHIIAYLLGYKPWEVPNFELIRDKDGKLQFPEQADIDPKYWLYRTDGLPVQVPSALIFVTGLPLSRGTKVLEKTFRLLWPPDVEFKFYTGPLGTWARVEYNGSVLSLGADTQKVQSFEGANHAAAFFDEPVRKTIFTAVRRGLIDHLGRVFWSLTPLGDARVSWIARDYIMTEEKQDSVGIIYGSPFDNPHISQEALKDFLNDPNLSKEEREARAEGKFGTIGRAIISTIDPGKTFIDPITIPRGVPRMLVVDPHHSKPACMAWFALLDDDHYIIYREWPNQRLHTMGIPQLDIPALALKIKELEGKEEVDYRYCDPSFGRQHAKVLGVRQRSFQEQMAEYKLYFDARVDNDLERGIEALREAFRPSPVSDRPRVQIFNNLVNVKDAVTLWSYEDTPSGELKVSENMKDFADVVRYGIMASPSMSLKTYGTESYLEDEEE